MLPRLPLLPIQHSRCYRVYESLATRPCWFCNDVLALQEAGLEVAAQICGFTGNGTRSLEINRRSFATTSLSFLFRELEKLIHYAACCQRRSVEKHGG